jgi:hypothetical protein
VDQGWELLQSVRHLLANHKSEQLQELEEVISIMRVMLFLLMIQMLLEEVERNLLKHLKKL